MVMFFKGIQKTSFIDYPSKISTVLFVGGCNFRCPYCHNGHLVQNKITLVITEEDALGFLESRKKSIDAVVVSGGEPTLFGSSLLAFLKKVKGMGFLAKLDTNGTNPNLLKTIIDNGIVDYVAMDIKAPIGKYEQVVNAKVNTESILESIKLLQGADIEYEFRTTVCKELLNENDIQTITKTLILPNDKYYLQNFKDGKTVLAGEGKLSPVVFLDDLQNSKIQCR